MELPIVFNNRYQLVKKIGEGGLAEVYQAQDMALGRMVAVKALRPQYTRDPNFLVNFHREAQSVARLSDPYIVSVYDFGQSKDRPYIVFEWIPGSDLRTVIDEQTTISVRQTVEYGIHICSAVGAAHRAGLVHGDLKPGNILVTPSNQAKVTDFGLARALGASAMDEGEVVWGTPAYFSPEQASGDRVLPATDVYAVGIILYEMLTGRVPFIGKDDQDVARKQLYEAHVPVDQINPNIPEPIARIVDAAMAKNPNERFLTADHMREALTTYKRGGLGHQTPISSVVGSPLQNAGLPVSVMPPPPKSAKGRYVSASQAATDYDEEERRGSINWLLMGLGLIAVFGVLAMVPLLIALYAALMPGAGASSPAVNTTEMPDLVGLEETAARTILQREGLSLLVEGQENHPTWPPLTVIRQSVAVGEPIEPGTTVNVILSEGPTVIDLPNLVGMQFDEAEQMLTTLDLVPQKYEEWSTETPGLVISQDPPAGTEVEDRTLITLVVSSGSRVPVSALFGEQILLNAYEIPRVQYRPGEAINLTFFWQATSPPTASYELLIYLTTPQGGIVSEIETRPQNGARPTDAWNVGEMIVDPYQLPIPVTTAPGDYQIRVSFSNPETGARLPIVDSGRGEQDNLGGLILRSVQVVP